MRESTGPLAVGRVTGAHGTGGAVRVQLHDRQSTSLQPGLDIELREAGTVRTLRIDRIAPKPGSDLVRVWFEGIADRDAAEGLRGHEIWVDRAALAPLQEGEFYLADLIGGAVEDREGRSLGTIVGVTTNGAQDLLEVQTAGGAQWYCPALPQFVVEHRDTGVVVDLLEGMGPEPREGPDRA